ncbi:glycoside hydrolase family 57 protein [Flagellimonas sp. 2504JD4-2]
MTSVCFYFQVHQPYRIRQLDFFDVGRCKNVFDVIQNRAILDKVSEKCYLPTNRLMLDLIEKHEGAFRISYSISGVALEQFERWRPDVLESFKKLVQTGCVELLSETYYHSLSSLYSKREFEMQIKEHRNMVKKHFGITPTVFRNTELIYNNEIASVISEMGYDGIIAEGVDKYLGFKSPNFLHHPPNNKEFPVLLKNYKLSDDIAFRFSDKNWSGFPLSSETFAHWMHGLAGNGDVVNLFMDYETFGEHQWAETGIFNFLEYLPENVLKHPDFDFKTPYEVIQSKSIKGDYNVPDISSWADTERDLSAWRSNSIQYEALRRIFDLEHSVYSTCNLNLISVWKKLTTSDHFYYMSTKYWADGDVHKYFSPYKTPIDAYNYFINACAQLEYELEKSTISKSISIKKKRRTGEKIKI